MTYQTQRQEFQSYIGARVSAKLYRKLKSMYADYKCVPSSGIKPNDYSFIQFALGKSELVKIGCDKVRYKSRKEAKQAMKRINRINPDYDLKSCYECKICNHWHLTKRGKGEIFLIQTGF